MTVTYSIKLHLFAMIPLAVCQSVQLTTRSKNLTSRNTWGDDKKVMATTRLPLEKRIHPPQRGDRQFANRNQQPHLLSR